MRRLLSLSVALVVLLSSSAVADIIYVHPGGAGDYLTIPEGVANAAADDTVLVAAGTYVASGAGWPITLHSASPTIASEEGAAATIIRNGTPFLTMAGDCDCRVRIMGFTITQTPSPLARGAGSCVWLLFTDNVVDDNDSGLDASASTGLIARNLIRDNGDRGIYTYHYWGIIEENEICGHVRGVIGACCENPTVRGNHIHHNTAAGSAAGIDARHIGNLVEHNGTGIYSGYSGEVQDNVIRFNEIGVRLHSSGAPFQGNDLYGNTAYNVMVHDCFGSVDATMNWWGTTDPDEIAATIWDCYDDPEIPCCIVFDPWCEAPGCDPVAVEPASWGAIKAMYR